MLRAIVWTRTTADLCNTHTPNDIYRHFGKKLFSCPAVFFTGRCFDYFQTSFINQYLSCLSHQIARSISSHVLFFSSDKLFGSRVLSLIFNLCLFDVQQFFPQTCRRLLIPIIYNECLYKSLLRMHSSGLNIENTRIIIDIEKK